MLENYRTIKMFCLWIWPLSLHLDPCTHLSEIATPVQARITRLAGEIISSDLICSCNGKGAVIYSDTVRGLAPADTVSILDIFSFPPLVLFARISFGANVISDEPFEGAELINRAWDHNGPIKGWSLCAWASRFSALPWRKMTSVWRRGTVYVRMCVFKECM